MTSDHQPATVCVISAGLAGLSAAYDLGRAGFRVIVLESESFIGGLASSIPLDDRPIERFYHFICRDDTDLIALVDELNLGGKLHWERSKTKFYYNGRPGRHAAFDLFRFSAVPSGSASASLNIISSRYTKCGKLMASLIRLIQQTGSKRTP